LFIPDPGSRIPDPDADFLPSRIPDPGVKKVPNPGSRIPDPDPQHCLLECEKMLGNVKKFVTINFEGENYIIN
jgi:hypothetical protein